MNLNSLAFDSTRGYLENTVREINECNVEILIGRVGIGLEIQLEAI